MVGLTPINITDIEQGSNVRVLFNATALIPPTDDDSWGVDSFGGGVSLDGNRVVINKIIRPKSSIGGSIEETISTTASQWSGTVSARLARKLTEEDTLVLKFEIPEAGTTVSSEPFDLAQNNQALDENLTKPQVDQETTPDTTAGDTLTDDELDRLSRVRQEQTSSTLPTVVWSAGTGFVPKIKQYELTGDGDSQQKKVISTFEPLEVSRLGGTLPWDTNSTQLQCGRTITDATDDMNMRLVYHARCTHKEVKKLLEMRQTPNRIMLDSDFYHGEVTFDELRVDRVADANGAMSATDGEIVQPIYEIQLQSKEQSGSQ